jgi:hypothetical protein
MSTSAATQILLSFPMADHGANFSYWLRVRLMRRYGWAHPNSVYMDCIASRQHKTVHLQPSVQVASAGNSASNTNHSIPAANRVKGVTIAQYDPRPHFDAQGYHPIGAANSEWNEAYMRAMAEAAVMIMVAIPAYLRSEWCLKEWGQYMDENRRRARTGRKAMTGIGIVFNQDTLEVSALKQQAAAAGGFKDPDKRVINLDTVEWFQTNKFYGSRTDGLWHPKDFGLSEGELARFFRLTDRRLKAAA